jgi:hypothetical protein
MVKVVILKKYLKNNCKGSAFSCSWIRDRTDVTNLERGTYFNKCHRHIHTWWQELCVEWLEAIDSL